MERLEQLARQFCMASRRLTDGPDRRGIRYPAFLKRKALAYLEEATEGGEPLSAIAAALEITPATLKRWEVEREEAEQDGSPLREVVVVDPSSEMDADTTVCLVTPEGYRIEGLRATEVASVLHSLRSP